MSSCTSTRRRCCTGSRKLTYLACLPVGAAVRVPRDGHRRLLRAVAVRSPGRADVHTVSTLPPRLPYEYCAHVTSTCNRWRAGPPSWARWSSASSPSPPGSHSCGDERDYAFTPRLGGTFLIPSGFVSFLRVHPTYTPWFVRAGKQAQSKWRPPRPRTRI